VMGSRLQSSGYPILTTVATLIPWPISSQLPDGTGTLRKGFSKSTSPVWKM
jgi:hypothetical protein